MLLLTSISAALLAVFGMTRFEAPKTIGKDQAEKIAKKVIDENAGEHDFVIMKDKTVERAFGWVFFYTTRKYLETHDPQYLVPGAAPLVVLREDGSTEFLPTSIPPTRAIELFQKRWEQRKSALKHENK
jgi:hypothetical protein